MNTTKILGEAVGIQSQGTVDKTETQTKEGLTSALIIGRFKRGRVDKPMTIHQGNIRGQLGYEPTNIDYQAVQDCLDTGVPSVQVLRVGQMIVDVDPEFPHTISCDGATHSVVFEENPDFTAWNSISSIVMNGVEYQKPEGLPEGELLPLNPTADGDQIRISIGGVHPNRTLIFENLGTRPARIKLKLFSSLEFVPNILDQGLNSSNNNPTVIFDNSNFEVSFCLSVPG